MGAARRAFRWRRLRTGASAQAYPQAAHLIPEGFEPNDGEAEGRQWFSARAVSDATRPQRVIAALPGLVAFIRDAQAHFAVTPVATALVGFSQGAILALETAQAHPGLVGRVVADFGRYATLPEATPDAVIHLVHGKDDPVIPARHSVEAATRLVALGGDVTADIVPGITHQPHPELVDRALGHLKDLPSAPGLGEAIAQAPLMATRADSRDLGKPVPPPAANDPV